MFENLTTESFDRILPGFQTNRRKLGSLVDVRHYNRAISGFDRLKDIFAFDAANYDDARFIRDRDFHVDAAYHEWSATKIAPEHLLRDLDNRSPEAVFSIACNLAHDLAAKIQSHGIHTVAFSIAMTPAGDGLDMNCYALHAVTGLEAVEEFGVLMGDQPQLVLRHVEQKS